MNKKIWLLYALITTVTWGMWGAFSKSPMDSGFPYTLVYAVWALTMIVPGIVILWIHKWQIQHDKKSILYGLIIGFLGAGGQLLLFQALKAGPAYLIFPIISISPAVTIMLSFFLLKERTGTLGIIGIILALLALPLFEYTKVDNTDGYGVLWFVLALIILTAWGIQAFFMKLANKTTDGASIFFYMTITGLILIPVALFMTDFSKDINWGVDGLWETAWVQVLNSIGALCLVFAYRYGKAIVVSPLANAGAPLMTAIISLVILGVMPSNTKILGIALAIVAALLIAIQPEDKTQQVTEP
ncbi:MAG: EamA family transporter [Bacteroidetes bacterium]|nr:EamA family transporter [Bacteroidota bacterium]